LSNVLNIQLHQGTDFSRLITLKTNDTPLNLLGATFLAVARENYNSPDVAFTFTLTLRDQTVVDNLGKIDWTCASNQLTALRLLNPKQYYYDVIMTFNAKKIPILSGQCVVKPLVSRPA